MEDDVLRYDEMVERALRDVVRQALVAVMKDGLPGSHHFYLSFRTDAAGVDMPAALRAQHPEELTIVLQHQYWDLEVMAEAFTVTVSFNQQPNKLVVPFAALLSFVDPSVNFGLQFNVAAPSADTAGDGALSRLGPGRPSPKDTNAGDTSAGDTPEPGANDTGGEPGDGGADVLTLDNFRKK